MESYGWGGARIGQKIERASEPAEARALGHTVAHGTRPAGARTHANDRAGQPGTLLPGLRATRQTMGVELPELARRTGLLLSFLVGIDNERRTASQDTAHRIADALGVPVARLGAATPTPEPRDHRRLNRIAEGLTWARQARGLSVPQLAWLAGVDAASIRMFEAGLQRASDQTVEKLAAALAIAPSYLTDVEPTD